MVRVYQDMDEMEENLEFIPGFDSRGKLCLDVCLDGKKIGVIDKDNKEIKVTVKIAEEEGESDADRIKYGGISLYDYDAIDEDYKNGERMITFEEARHHYMEGSKTPLNIKLEFLDMSRFAPGEHENFLKVIAPYHRGKGVFKISTEVPYNTKSMVIGYHTMLVEGKLTSNGQAWSFKGTYKSALGYDPYDFRPSTHRGFWGELATTLGRITGGEKARPYRIYINGSESISLSGVWDE